MLFIDSYNLIAPKQLNENRDEFGDEKHRTVTVRRLSAVIGLVTLLFKTRNIEIKFISNDLKQSLI